MSRVKYEISLYTKRLRFVFLVHRANLQHMWNARQDVGPSKGWVQICEGKGDGVEIKALVGLRKQPLSVTNGACAVGLWEDLCRHLALHVRAFLWIRQVLKWNGAQRTRHPPGLSAARPHDGSEGSQAQLLRALPRGEMPNAEREYPCQLGTFRPCGFCWRGAVIVMCWGRTEPETVLLVPCKWRSLIVANIKY